MRVYIIIFIHIQNDIYFATTAPEFFHGKMERLQMDQQKAERESMSPPASPHRNYTFYFIICILVNCGALLLHFHTTITLVLCVLNASFDINS